jgi:hypothetical protein
MGKARILALFLIFVSVGQAAAEKLPVNLSVWYPFSINQAKDAEVNLNLSLLKGEVGRVEGLDFAGLASIIQTDMRGVQVTGIAGVAGEDLWGLQAAGLATVAGEDAWGVQVAGFANVVGMDQEGLQVSGFANVVGGSSWGAQMTLFGNVVGMELTGIQGSGFANVVGEDLQGIQATGFANVVGGDLKGLQAAGFANVVGGTLSGVQIGMVNVAAESRGLQIGLINTAEEQHGLPLGLVIRGEDETIDYVAYGSSLGAVNLGVWFEINGWTSMLSVGSVNLSQDINEALISAWHFGRRLHLARFDLTLDLGVMRVDNEDLFESGGDDRNALQGRLIAAWQGKERLGWFAGGGLTRLYEDGWENGETEPLYLAGISYRR